MCPRKPLVRPSLLPCGSMVVMSPWLDQRSVFASSAGAKTTSAAAARIVAILMIPPGFSGGFSAFEGGVAAMVTFPHHDRGIVPRGCLPHRGAGHRRGLRRARHRPRPHRVL